MSGDEDELAERKHALDVKRLRDKIEKICRGKPVIVAMDAMFSTLDMFYIMYGVKPEKVDQILKDFCVIGSAPVVTNIPSEEDRLVVSECFIQNIRILIDLVEFAGIKEGM